ncbi:hypothetical protein TrVE_jg694 [Triparma verrucosa]|uniref:BspA family leucine-rich repeat surface protein n=1 Tax=Triparma verrucosa TaxID=1606542 RepID=A0A9W7DQ22_9STRA|nr:hypothetical protein TrVE_jg694 [Triparma verrucosa]
MDSTIELNDNPMHADLERGQSNKAFDKTQTDLEKQAQSAQEKMAGKTGVSATDSVDQNALAEVQTPIAGLMSGAGAGGLYEMVTIGIGFLQSFGLVITIDVQWPESFQRLFEWLEVFSLNFAFGGANLGVCLSIFSGLLVPPWLIWMFDATWRKKFGTQSYLNRYRQLWVLLSIGFGAISCVGAYLNWYKSDVLDALFLVLSVLFALTALYQYYLYSASLTCKEANEDFGKTRQHFEMFLFVFLYQVAYLCGVLSCITIVTTTSGETSLVGKCLLPFYLFVAPVHLFRIGKKVKSKLKINTDQTLDYRESLKKVQRKYQQEKTDIHQIPDEQKLTYYDESYKAAVIESLLGSNEENFWWWRIFLMLERATLAIMVYTGALSWFAVGVAATGWLASLGCRPYWNVAEDRLDIMVRLTTTLTCLGAGLYEDGIVAEDETWLEWVLNTISFATLIALIAFIGPKRLVKDAWDWFKKWKRAKSMRSGGIKTIEDAMQLDETEFNQFSIKVKLLSCNNLPDVKIFKEYVESLASGKHKFKNDELRYAVKEWKKYPNRAERTFGHISGFDVSEVTNMSHLFKDFKNFCADISKWNVSKTTDMQSMFENVKSSHFGLGTPILLNESVICVILSFLEPNHIHPHTRLPDWDVSNVTSMSRMFKNSCFDNTCTKNWISEKRKFDNQQLRMAVKDFCKDTDSATLFYGPISNWDVSEVTDMSALFKDTNFDKDISSWNVANVTNFRQTFHNATRFSADISSWNVANVTNFSEMFRNAYSFRQNLSRWRVKAGINSSMKDMFRGAPLSNHDHLNNWASTPNKETFWVWLYDRIAKYVLKYVLTPLAYLIADLDKIVGAVALPINVAAVGFFPFILCFMIYQVLW